MRHKRVSIFDIFNVFHHSLCFMLKSNVLMSDVDVDPLHDHDIKINVNLLTPNQITFCLANTKKQNF